MRLPMRCMALGLVATACGAPLAANDKTRRGRKPSAAAPPGTVISEPGAPVKVVAQDGRFLFYPRSRFTGYRLPAQGEAPPRRKPAPEEIKPGADLSGCDLAGRNLSGASLAGARLVEADLTGAKLCGTDLTGADLAGALLQNVTANAKTLWEGANLCKASILGAVGLDLAGVRLHPFFEQDPATGKGPTIQEYALPDPGFRPTQIHLGPQGDLFLTEKGSGRLWIISPTGATVKMDFLSADVHAAAMDGKGGFWALGEGTAGLLPGSITSFGSKFAAGGSGGLVVPFAAQRMPLPSGRALAAVASDQGTLWVSGPGTCVGLVRGAGDKVKVIPHALGPWNLTSLATSADGRFLFGADPERESIRMIDLGAKRNGQLPLPAGCRAGRLARGADGRIWFTFQGKEEGLGWLTLVEGEPQLTFLTLKGIVRDRHGMTFAPDGRLWFAQQQPPSLGVLDPATLGRETCLLPEGMVPEELVAAKDGTLYFTLKDRAAIGCLRMNQAAKVPEPKEAGPAAPWEASPVYQPRPERERISGRARREKALAMVLAREEGQEPFVPRGAGPAGPKAPGPAGPKASVPAGPKAPAAAVPAVSEHKAAPAAPPAAAPPPRPALEVLEDMDIHVSDHQLRHILDRHSFNLDNGNGQFKAEFSTAEALPDLLLRGVRKAGEVGLVVRRYDPMGIRHTPVRMDEAVGYYYVPYLDEWRETAWFDIVTKDVVLEDRSRAQVVLSAYPISPNRF